MNPENTTLRSYLEDLVDVAEWNWLTDLAKQGKVLFLANHLDLVEVGMALAEDDVSKVQEWLKDGWIYHPSEAQMLALDACYQVEDLDSVAKKLQFESLIVQPFVLAKNISTAN